MHVANSLTVGGYELIGRRVNPEYKLGSGMDFGEVMPDTATISSLLLDGDVISGERTGNRTWNLVAVVIGGNRADLAIKVGTFIDAINSDTFQVVWTPDGCASSLFTAYRATFTVQKNLAIQGQFVAQVVFSFQTGPFAASLTPSSISVTASSAPAQIQVDGMNSGSFTHGFLDTTNRYEGAGSVTTLMTQSPTTGIVTPNTFSRTISSTNLSAYNAMSVRLRDLNIPTPGFSGPAKVTLTLTLFSTGGSNTYAPVTITITPRDTAWHLISFDLTLATSSGSVDLSAVTSWAITVAIVTSTLCTGLTVNLDDLRAYPPASIGNMTGEGAVLTIPAVAGTARTPVALAVDIGGSTFTNLLLHSPPVGQNPDTTILAGLSGGGSATVPSAKMKYDSTYSVVVAFSTTATASRTITVTVTQNIGAGFVSQAITTTVSGPQFLLSVGEITLPLMAIPPENTICSTTIAVTSSNVTDAFTDVALCDTQGQTILINGMGSTNTRAYVDQPDPLVGIGDVYQSATDRTGAFSAMQFAVISGGPMLFEPGDNRLLLLSTAGAPNVTVSLYPQYLDEALA